MERIEKNIWDFQVFPKWDYSEKEYFEKHQKMFEFISRDIITRKDGTNISILDIGCATGIGFKDSNLKKTSKIYGVDFVKDYIELFNARGMEGSVADIMKDHLPYVDNFFDVVICGSIIEHTLKPKDLISEVGRVIKKDGLLIITVPNATSGRARFNLLMGRNNFRPLIDDLMHYDHLKRCGVLYSVRELELILRESFKIEKVRFLQENRNGALLEKLLKFAVLLFPQMSDNIYLIATKR